MYTHFGLLKVVLDTSINYFGTIYYNILYTYHVQYNKYSWYIGTYTAAV